MYLVTGTAVIFLFTIFSVVQARQTDDEVSKLLAAILQDDFDDLENKRVINGEVAKVGWPWLVSLRTLEFDPSIEYHFCGASLVNSRWALTAAHCFDGKTTEELNNDKEYLGLLSARLGDTEVKTSAEEELMDMLARLMNELGDLADLDKEDIAELKDWMDWKVGFEKVIVHSGFNPKANLVNDIALVKFDQDVPATPDVVSRIQSVTLPDQTDDVNWPAPGQNCSFKGWGCTEIGGGEAGSNTLLKINMTVGSRDTCKNMGIKEEEKSFCAGSMPTQEDFEILNLLHQYDLAHLTLEDLRKFVKEKMGDAAETVQEALNRWEAEGGSSLCPGDSGGPLMCEKDGEWVQAGITSFGESTATVTAITFPNAFTRVSHYADWIHKNIEEN